MTIVEHNWSALLVPYAIEVPDRIPTIDVNPLELPFVEMDL